MAFNIIPNTGLWGTIANLFNSNFDALTTTMSTRASIGNTVATSGVISPIALSGTGDVSLPPQTIPQPRVGGDYAGYVELTGLSLIGVSTGEVSVVGNEFLIGANGGGNYRTPHAWLDISGDTTNTVVGFIFGIHKASDGLLYFSQRVTGEKVNSQNSSTNVGGGGFIPNLEAGDKISVWAASSSSTNLSVYDANLGLEMAIHSSIL